MFLLEQLPSLHSGAHSFLPDQNLTSESDQSSVDCCKMPSLQLLNCWTCLMIKCLKYNPHERRCSPGWSVCACVCVCVCARARRAPKQTSKVHFELRARPNDQIHTKHIKTAGLESIHLNIVYILKWTRTVGRKLCFNILFKWQTGASLMLIKEQNANRKTLTALNLNKVIALISINLSIHTVKTMQCSFIFDHF